MPDGPINISAHPPPGSYGLSGWKTDKRAVSPGPTEDASITNVSTTARAANVNSTVEIDKVEGLDL